MNAWPAIWLTMQLAAVTTVILLIIALPLGWWLATTKARIRPLVEAITALPLVLPPTVLGFYLLILMRPDAPLGGLWVRATGDTLAFSFAGLVVASVVYSLPFAVQPMQTAFMAVPAATLEAARTLGASARDAFFSVSLPLARRGFVTAAVLSFAHTVGEFGVVLMVGGNIPGKTRVISIEIFTAVETLDYATAHILSAWLLVFSFMALTLVYIFNRRGGARLG
jgi:molybdate transport system permease protein